MSILWTLRKHIDAIQQREEDARRRKALDVPHMTVDEGVGPRRQQSEPIESKRYRCRVCELVADSAEYCPECLADTMELVSGE